MKLILILFKTALLFSSCLFDIFISGICVMFFPIIAIPFLYANEIDKHRAKK